MKWHIVCLITIILLNVNPVASTSQGAAAPGPDEVWFVRTGQTSDRDVNCLLRWAHWSAVALACGAYPGRVTLCRWTLRWQGRRPLSRKKRLLGERNSAAPGSGQRSDGSRQASGDESESLSTTGHSLKVGG